jgi:hypothetical protein
MSSGAEAGRFALDMHLCEGSMNVQKLKIRDGKYFWLTRILPVLNVAGGGDFCAMSDMQGVGE